MVRMLVYYVFTTILILAGTGALAVETVQLLLGALTLANAPLAAALVGGPLLLSRFTWNRARKLRNEVEAEYRMRFALDLAARNRGLLSGEQLQRSMDLSAGQAQRLLEDLARRGHGEMESDEEGQLLLSTRNTRMVPDREPRRLPGPVGD